MVQLRLRLLEERRLVQQQGRGGKLVQSMGHGHAQGYAAPEPEYFGWEGIGGGWLRWAICPAASILDPVHEKLHSRLKHVRVWPRHRSCTNATGPRLCREAVRNRLGSSTSWAPRGCLVSAWIGQRANWTVVDPDRCVDKFVDNGCVLGCWTRDSHLILLLSLTPVAEFNASFSWRF